MFFLYLYLCIYIRLSVYAWDMLFRRPISGVRDIIRGGNIAYRLSNKLSPQTTKDDFTVERVVQDACIAAGVQMLEPQQCISHYRWWEKLCCACGNKPTSASGAYRLRFRLVHALSTKLALDEIYRLNKNEIESSGNIEDPFIVFGLPRSHGHMAAHVLARSGVFLSPTQRDTFSPSLLLQEDRNSAFKKHFRWFHRVNPNFASVRQIQANQVDDDLLLHLLTPQSLAWGLLHGLDEYLLECIEEDQMCTFEEVKRVLQVFQWYKRCGHFDVAVPNQVEPIDNQLETQTFGTKHDILKDQWIIHSPFAILSSEALHKVFPSMHVIWVHRALSQCVPSLCSSLCLHNAIYTGKPPADSQLASVGEKVLGLFGSGSQNAVRYFGNFEKQKMVHWSNRDIKRHAARLAEKTMGFWNIDLDRYRRLQMINGQTEYIEEGFRPLHDAQMPYFCIHEGIIGDVFQDYIYQFEEFAFEKRLGVTIEGYRPIAATADEMSMGTGLLGKSSGGLPAGSLGRGQPIEDHFLEESKGFR